MSYIGSVLPRLDSWRFLLSRDQWVLLMAAINQLFMSLDTYLAHSVHDIRPNEWIPIIFGAIAGLLLLLAGLIAFRNRPLAILLANAVFVASMVVGLLGIYFHLSRTRLLEDIGQGVTALVWAPPVLGPAFFFLIGALGISAAWIESPPDSGRLRLWGERTIQLPYSKTRAYCLIVALMILATVVSSVFDHARFQLSSIWVWLPLVAGLFGMTTSLYLGFIAQPSRQDISVHIVAMIWLLMVGALGFVLHANTNLVPDGSIVVERFLRGSPLLAPLLFANMGLLGLMVLLAPSEEEA